MLPRKSLAAATIGLVTVCTIAQTQAPATAAPKLRFSAVQYDSPGADTGSNASLNKEWFRIRNYSGTRRNLGGWIVRDRSGHRYVFSDGFSVGPGKTVTVHTGDGDNTRRHRYWGKDQYVWNNTGDRATLKRPSGAVVDRCAWGDGSGFTTC